MIIFTQVKLIPEQNKNSITTVLPGIPKNLEEMQSQIIVENYLKTMPKGIKIFADCKTLGYGAGERCDADRYETAYMIARQFRDNTFFNTRCELIQDYNFEFTI